MSFAWYICVLFISIIALVNREQVLNITILLVLFASASAAAVLVT